MSETVLVVDDSLTVRMGLVDAFEAAGFHAVPCATASEAREAFARGDASVVVLDVILPDGDGVELLRELRASAAGASVAVLLLSTEAEVKDRVRGLRMGADDYVGKPYDAGYVVARARELLQARRAHHSTESPVLVIDDSVTFREALRDALEHAGYAVIVANDGEEGLRLAAAHRPRGIVVDGVLPGIDGAGVIRRVRLDVALRDVPCILLTGSEDRGAELRSLDAGADAFVRKEEPIDAILARIGAVLRRGAGMAPKQAASSHGPQKILAVDDSPTYLNELGAVLREERYEVVLARSGEEALELLAVEPVDCILLDLLMPGIGGQEACRRIKAAPIVRDIPLVMLTALDDPHAMLEGLGAGADDYIAKSSDFEVLKARVRAQIRRKQFEDENRRIREELLQKELEAQEARAARNLAETRASLVEELERKNRELQAFSYSVSHDLRAPLRGIDGLSLALLEDYGEALDARGRDYLQRVRAGAERMAELIDALLQLARFSRHELRRQSVDLSREALAVLAEHQRREPDRRVDVAVAGGLVADADPRLLRVVLDNLLGNAWKFTSKKDGARIEVAAIPLDGEVVYRIRDDGAGFDMSYSAKLFRPFQRLHGETEFAGTGIGLATVQRIVDLHGGRVWAEGEVGRGASFLFTLGRKVADAR
ncbi:MAG TPA: response regulator [Polyangiaceae bacterium]